MFPWQPLTSWQAPFSHFSSRYSISASAVMFLMLHLKLNLYSLAVRLMLTDFKMIWFENLWMLCSLMYFLIKNLFISLQGRYIAESLNLILSAHKIAASYSNPELTNAETQSKFIGQTWPVACWQLQTQEFISVQSLLVIVLTFTWNCWQHCRITL